MTADPIMALAACTAAPERAPGRTVGSSADTVVAASEPAVGSQDNPLVCMAERRNVSRVHARRVCKLASTWTREEGMAQDLGVDIQRSGSFNRPRGP